MGTRSLIRSVEVELGKLPHLLIFTVLEWMLIGILFLNEFLTFAANEFANFLHLKIPCLLCSSNSNHVMVHKDSDCYCNDSICEFHKKGISSLAYCHNHKKLSDINKMCEGCLLSFVTERESDCNTYKSLAGVLHKDMECFVGDEIEIQLGLFNDEVDVETSNTQQCSCCGEPLKVKSSHYKAEDAGTFSQAPASAPSPPANLGGIQNNEEPQSLELPQVRCKELVPEFDDSELHEDDNVSNVNRQDTKLRIKLKEDTKAASVPLLTEADDLKDKKKPPSITTGNKVVGIPHGDSAPNSPRWSYRINKQSTLEKTGSTPESKEGSTSNEGEEAILDLSNRHVRLDRKPLMALYMELDEERSASAVAANNAMAMITRLQAEKAAMQMEAVQYQRMLEEEVEYDEESLRATNEKLLKREEEVKELETELSIYREKYGSLMEDEFEESKNVNAEVHQEFNSQPSLSHISNISPPKLDDGQDKKEKDLTDHQAVSPQVDNGGEKINEPLRDFKGKKTHLLGQKKKLENKTHLAENGKQNVNNVYNETGEGSEASLAELSCHTDRVKILEVENMCSESVSRNLDVSESGEAPALFYES